jgi:co-chaperonin GroES (HSP10)
MATTDAGAFPLKAIADRIIVKPIERISVTAGIILPATLEGGDEDNMVEVGLVVSAGGGVFVPETGKTEPLAVAKGMTVAFIRFGGYTLNIKSGPWKGGYRVIAISEVIGPFAEGALVAPTIDGIIVRPAIGADDKEVA